MRIILPNTYVDSTIIDKPLFFLAGPIRGGENWQQACCLEIEKHLPDFFAVVPCRWEKGYSLFKHRQAGVDNFFKRQTVWEYYYLRRASELSKEHKGCIIFWLPEPARNYKGEYARDSRGEIARWGSHQRYHRRTHCCWG